MQEPEIKLASSFIVDGPPIGVEHYWRASAAQELLIALLDIPAKANRRKVQEIIAKALKERERNAA